VNYGRHRENINSEDSRKNNKEFNAEEAEDTEDAEGLNKKL